MRYWFLAPCCGRRCQVFYIPTFDNTAQMIPACRICLDLNYASQQQCYIERHKTYEKHLLSNYGYTWAKWEHHLLKENYLKITPGWGYVMQESIFKRELELLKHLISVNRMFLQMYLCEFKSLTSLEDLLAYLAHLVETHGEEYALELARMAKISNQVKQDIDTMSSIAFGQAYMESMQDEPLPRTVPNDEEDVTAIIGLRTMFERKKAIEARLKILESLKFAA